MRKLSCKWPVRLSSLAFAPPVFYVLFRIGKFELFNAMELATKVLVAFVFTTIFWLIYGISCFLSKPKGLNENLESHDKIHKDEATVFKSVRPSGVLRKKKVKNFRRL